MNKMELPSAIRILQEQAEQYNRLHRAACLDMYEQMERTWAPRRHHIELMERIKIDNATFRAHEIAVSHQRLVDMAQKARENFQWVEDIRTAHSSWRENIKPLQDNLTCLWASLEPHLTEISRYLIASERLFVGIDFSAISQTYTLPVSFVLRTQNAFANLTQSYEKLVGSIKTLPELIELPSYALPSAGREIFVAGYAIKRICPLTIETEEEGDLDESFLVTKTEQEVSGSLELLRRVNPALVKPYLGAREAFNSDNADRERHIFTSLRELWNHLLRQLAPDEKVINWLPKDKSEYLCKGKPTRKARILYICRGINHAPLSDFIDHDTISFILLIEFLNRFHELEIKISEEQLKAIILKTDSWLTYILNIWREGK